SRNSVGVLLVESFATFVWSPVPVPTAADTVMSEAEVAVTVTCVLTDVVELYTSTRSPILNCVLFGPVILVWAVSRAVPLTGAYLFILTIQVSSVVAAAPVTASRRVTPVELVPVMTETPVDVGAAPAFTTRDTATKSPTVYSLLFAFPVIVLKSAERVLPKAGRFAFILEIKRSVV